MSVVYSQSVIDARLNGVVTALGASAQLLLQVNGATVSTINLANPVGSVSGGILTFTVPLNDPAAAGTGNVNGAIILDSAAATAISGLTVGIPLSGADVIISNGLNSTLVSSGQVVSLIGAQITGS